LPPSALAQTLHSTVVEILLYMTPHHRADIINSLATSLNATYQRFLARNPGFNVSGRGLLGVGRCACQGST